MVSVIDTIRLKLIRFLAPQIDRTIEDLEAVAVGMIDLHSLPISTGADIVNMSIENARAFNRLMKHDPNLTALERQKSLMIQVDRFVRRMEKKHPDKELCSYCENSKLPDDISQALNAELGDMS